MFQEPRLLPWLTVADNVGFGLAGVDYAERRERVEQALRSVGLADQAGKWPREMSGGMAQRIALARALVTRPSVLLLDEPFSALDALTCAGLQDHLVQLWEQSRPTLVLVTHDIEEALVVANQVVVLRTAPRPNRRSDSTSRWTIPGTVTAMSSRRSSGTSGRHSTGHWRTSAEVRCTRRLPSASAEERRTTSLHSSSAGSFLFATCCDKQKWFT